MDSSTAKPSMTLNELLGRMQSHGEEESVSFGTLLFTMEKRGFGPMLAVPAFICSTPIGALPGVPSMTGITIMLIAIQMLVSKQHPWLPGPIRDIPVSRAKLNSGIRRMKPWMARIDRFLVPRWLFVQHPVFRSLVAVSCALCGLSMIPLEIVPFVGFIPALSVLVMAIGLTTDDGAVASVGLIAALSGLMLGTQQVYTLVS
ncbi:exopolysaccharide biosynthesis protein [Alteromonas sp. C1M14]|uniref:exopolysaccharide biosynthesis protein n=1 Tax=Alteromonas sp. C1M14 TaxID=2841567 RepID=UPI001C096FD7|nr:exopolysaccharide biosynthesis protein [Alteromonas sp. C1M14]MBU2977167.1 exopolysaccharide biosynthesis protein [Alteromonas sp. C1M14]